MKTDINLVKKENSFFFKEVKKKEEIKVKEECDGYFICNEEKEVRRIISFLKEKKIKKQIALFSQNVGEIRRFIETIKKFDYLVSPEFNEGKDSLKQRSSGLNEYLVKECAKKKIKILISLSFLESKDNFEKAKIISRIIQNIKLCRKKNCEIKIASFSKEKFFDKLERERIGFSLGMSSQQVSKCSIFED